MPQFVDCLWNVDGSRFPWVTLIVIVVKCGKMESQKQTDTVHHASHKFDQVDGGEVCG